MGILNQIANRIRGLRGGATGTAERVFPDTLALADFWTSTDGDVALVTSEYRELGSGYKVPPQQRIVWGQGKEEAPDNQGYAYMKVMTTADTEIVGTVRFSVADNGKFAKTVVMQERTERLSASQTDRRIMKPFPAATQRVAVEDEYLLVSMKPDSAATADQNGTSSKFILPITRIAQVAA